VFTFVFVLDFLFLFYFVVPSVDIKVGGILKSRRVPMLEDAEMPRWKKYWHSLKVYLNLTAYLVWFMQSGHRNPTVDATAPTRKNFCENHWARGLCYCTKGWNIIILATLPLLVTIADVYFYGDFLVNYFQMCRHLQQCLCSISLSVTVGDFAKDYTLS
jgi:hypothetical protein